jgi:hypothetical protein
MPTEEVLEDGYSSRAENAFWTIVDSATLVYWCMSVLIRRWMLARVFAADGCLEIVNR